MDSVTTILDVQGVNVAVEGGEDLPTDDVVPHQEGPEEHQPPQERHDHTDRHTSLQCGCPRHKADGDPKQTHPGPLFDQLKMSSGENQVLHLKLLFESKAVWAAPAGECRYQLALNVQCTVMQTLQYISKFFAKSVHIYSVQKQILSLFCFFRSRKTKKRSVQITREPQQSNSC